MLMLYLMAKLLVPLLLLLLLSIFILYAADIREPTFARNYVDAFYITMYFVWINVLNV